jgi:hypothetical protein
MKKVIQKILNNVFSNKKKKERVEGLKEYMIYFNDKNTTFYSKKFDRREKFYDYI